jgi:nucleotide-binding universal stress UspA family protein
MTTRAPHHQPASAAAGEQIAHGRVIAAVDGSPNSLAALRRAASQARHRRAELHIVYVIAPAADAEAVTDGHVLLTGAIKQAFPDDPLLTYCCRVERGEPAQVLVQLSDSADLLVLGGHRNPGHGDILSGEIVSRCLGYAHCPVDICTDDSRHAI